MNLGSLGEVVTKDKMLAMAEELEQAASLSYLFRKLRYSATNLAGNVDRHKSAQDSVSHTLKKAPWHWIWFRGSLGQTCLLSRNHLDLFLVAHSPLRRPYMTICIPERTWLSLETKGPMINIGHQPVRNAIRGEFRAVENKGGLLETEAV